MKLLISLGLVLAILMSMSLADRKLTAEFNPGCSKHDSCSSFSKLAYVRAEGNNDTVHFIFDFSSARKPSLVVITTVIDAVIQIIYSDADVENTIKFSETPLYTFASVFNKLYEFNDVNETAKIENGEEFITMDFKLYDWNMTQLINLKNEFVEISISSFKAYRAAGISKNGTVSLTLRVYGKDGIGSMLPHLTHTPESGELTLTLDKLHTNYTKSRFAVELLTISSLPFIKSEELTSNTYLDDKLSAGTFLNYFVEAKGGNRQTGGYLSWKPVVYKAVETHPLNSSSTLQYGIQDHQIEADWINSPLYKLYGNKLFNGNYLMKAVNVSFGGPNDEFYKKSNYLYWTFLVGVGGPPNSSLGGFLEMSVIACLLLMLTITMIMIFCIFMRWVSSKRNSIIYGQ